jgi:hypothetical protein
LTQPISSITVQVFTYAISPYEDWAPGRHGRRAACSSAIVLICPWRHASPAARVARIRGAIGGEWNHSGDSTPHREGDAVPTEPRISSSRSTSNISRSSYGDKRALE